MTKRKEVLREVFNVLKDTHPVAATKVASMAFEQTPREWASQHANEYKGQKLAFIKALRDEVRGMTLKRSKMIVDEVYEEGKD